MSPHDAPDPPGPAMSRVSAPFWAATREQRLVLQHCSSCARAVWYPRVRCPHCASDALEWHEATGRGTVYAVSVQYRPGHPRLKERVPYAVVLVDLDEGVRLMSTVVGTDPETVQIGQTVRAGWEPLDGGFHLLVFEPAS